MKRLLRRPLLPAPVLFPALAIALLIAACGGNSPRPLTPPAHRATAEPAVTAPATATTSTTAAGACRLRGALPDPACTPGATNPAVTQDTIRQTICVRGYTATIRPPVSVTGPIKTERMQAYGLTIPRAGAELDHLISLELGGAPADVANLWPEPYQPTPGARQKDLVENYLHAQVCNGSIPLAAAQHEIATDWLAVYNEVGPATLARYGYHPSTSDR